VITEQAFALACLVVGGILLVVAGIGALIHGVDDE
jgi:hypothetical protein